MAGGGGRDKETREGGDGERDERGLGTGRGEGWKGEGGRGTWAGIVHVGVALYGEKME
jgi:hypothetical protein